MGTGVGFRQFLDLAVAARRCELDTDWLTKALAEQNLLVFAQTCSALLERWFGAPLPLWPVFMVLFASCGKKALDISSSMRYNGGKERKRK